METYGVNLAKGNLFKDNMIDNFMAKGQNEREIVPDHPVAQMQHQGFKKDEMTKLKKYADLYGSGYTFQLCLERNALANMKRDFPLRSNNFALNLHLGAYDKIDFPDFIGRDKPFDVDQSLFRQAEKIYLD